MKDSDRIADTVDPNQTAPVQMTNMHAYTKTSMQISL